MLWQLTEDFKEKTLKKNLSNIEYQYHILPKKIWIILHSVHSYDIYVLQEIYSVILHIYKWGYLGVAYKDSPKKVF